MSGRVAGILAAVVSLMAHAPGLVAGQSVLVRDFLIGQADAASADGVVFTDIQAMALGNGRLYVLQHEERAVRIFDENGTYLKSIGGKGQGPGEFILPIALGFADTLLWIADSGNSRISYFSPDGRFVDSRRVPGPANALVRQRIMGALAGGTVAVTTQPLESVLRANPSTTTLVRLDADGSTRAIAQIPAGRYSGVQFRAAGAGGIIQTRHPFEDDPIVSLVPGSDGFLVVERPTPTSSIGHFTVMRLSPAGDTIYRRRFQYPAVRTPESLRDSIVSVWAEFLVDRRMYPGLRQAMAHVSEALAIPDWLPTIKDAFVGSDGAVWLYRHPPPTMNGTHLTRIQSTASEADLITSTSRFIPMAATHSSIYGVSVDELGVPRIVRYIIRAER